MYKLSLKSIIFLVLFGLLFGGVFVAQAITPTLSLSTTDNGNSVQLTINGDSNANVFFYYQDIYSGLQSQYIGTTNSYGYFSTTINKSTYNINTSSYVYVMVNNQQSELMAWPNGSSQGNLSLSQTNITLSVDQSQNITIYGGYTPYSMYSSNLNIFQAVISGNTLTVSGQNAGSGSLNICSSNGGCVNLYVTVSGSGNYYGGQISFSQNNVSLNAGNSTSVTIYGSGNYYVSNNSNSSIASGNISANSINIYGYSYGNANITVCQNYGQCAVLYVSVNYGYNYSAAAPITFSQNNIILPLNQTKSVSIYGGSGGNYYNGNYYNYGSYYSGSYYIGYNSNTSSVQTSLSGNSLTLTGQTNSVTVIVICSASNNCGALTITVGEPLVYNQYNQYSQYSQYNQYSQNWIYCSGENQYCYFSGTKSVRYGANGSYYYKSATNGIWCSNSTFGDPAYGSIKQCSYSN